MMWASFVIVRAINRDHASAGYEYLRSRLQSDEWRGVLNCVRFHHASALRQARIADDDPAYIVCVADNVAAAADRRAIEGEAGSVRFVVRAA